MTAEVELVAPNGRAMYRKPEDDPLVAKAREMKGWVVRPAPDAPFVMLENSQDGPRPYKARSEKYGEIILLSETCKGGCRRGDWDAETGLVECRDCHRIFDPDDPEPEPCVGCGKRIEGPAWWAADKGEDWLLCDACAGWKP